MLAMFDHLEKKLVNYVVHDSSSSNGIICPWWPRIKLRFQQETSFLHWGLLTWTHRIDWGKLCRGNSQRKIMSKFTNFTGFCGSKRVFGFSLVARQCWLEKRATFLQVVLVDSAIIREQQTASGKDVSILLYGIILLSDPFLIHSYLTTKLLHIQLQGCEMEVVIFAALIRSFCWVARQIENRTEVWMESI